MTNFNRFLWYAPIIVKIHIKIIKNSKGAKRAINKDCILNSFVYE